MKKHEIARQLARQSGVTQGEAADCLDRVVRDILERLREGKAADFPGMGHFRSGANGKIDFERSRRRSDA